MVVGAMGGSWLLLEACRGRAKIPEWQLVARTQLWQMELPLRSVPCVLTFLIAVYCRPQVRRSGTTADKVAAMSLMVGSSAAGGLKSLDGLLGMMGKSGGGKQLVLAAMEALQVC